MPFDAIVIGSGFGGAITACRLQEKNYRVLVLERGRRWSRFPRGPDDPWIWDADAPQRKNGWFELRFFPNMAVAAGAGVGGGSLVYANISCEAHPFRFAKGWPKEITYDELKPYYDAVKRVMNVREVPDGQWTLRMNLMKEGAEKAGFGSKFRKLELAVTFDDAWSYADFDKGASASKRVVNAQGVEQGTCVHCGNCDIGCDVGARNTLDLNYLYVAERKGADIRPLHLVTGIEPVDAGYRVHYDVLEGGKRTPGSECARLVIVAAGSLGSTELLLTCKYVTKTLPNISNCLGMNWSSNGDFLTPAVYADRKVQPSQGPTIASVIDLYDPGEDGGFWIEDGGLPNLAANFLEWASTNPFAGFRERILLDYARRFITKEGLLPNVMPWFAMGIDAADGVLTLTPRSLLDRRPRLHLDWDIRKSERVIQRIVAMHRNLAEVTGGIALVPPTWTLLRNLITPHPLGGCNMGVDHTGGVVDHSGQVFGYPGLYVADGAIVPEALGVNPSRTIGALAERIAALIGAKG